MKKICCIVCGKCRKFKNFEISYIFGKLLVLSIICDKCGGKNKNIFKEKESNEILKILALMYNDFENMKKNHD